MKTYLDIVQENHLDVLLQKNPTSKFLRGYLTRMLPGLTKLPTCSSWAEWRKWLTSQQLPKDAILARASQCTDEISVYLRRFLPRETEFNVEQEVFINAVSQNIQQFYFEDILAHSYDELEEIFESVFEASTLEDLNAIDIEKLVREVLEACIEVLEFCINFCDDNVEESCPEINLNNIEIVDYSVENQSYGRLENLVQEFVSNLIEQRMFELNAGATESEEDLLF